MDARRSDTALKLMEKRYIPPPPPTAAEHTLQIFKKAETTECYQQNTLNTSERVDGL